MNQSFGARLRHERERRKINLRSIAEDTKISIGLLEGLERDDVRRWPSGIFRKAFVRSYALAIGVDADAVLREFVERYPDPADATTSPAPGAPAPAPARRDRVRALVRDLPPVHVRFTIVSTASAFTKGAFIADMRRRWLAAACDVGVSCAIALVVFPVLGRFWTPLGVSMLCYFVGGIVILGNTPGVCLFAPPPEKAGLKP